MNTLAEPAEAASAELPDAPRDLIDRIALALPEEIRGEYYRELIHCRTLPESDEMLRLLRAMQFLVLLIEQAPSRVAEERARLDTLLAAAVGNISRMSASSEVWHTDLDRRLCTLPADIASGISPEAVAGAINENLKQEFVQSTIPQTAESLAAIAGQMKSVCRDFAITSESLGHVYQGAAEDARKAVASIGDEIAGATENAERFTKALTAKFSEAYRWSLVTLAAGSLVLGLAIGMMFDHWVLAPEPVAAPMVQSPAAPAAPQSSPQSSPQTASPANPR